MCGIGFFLKCHHHESNKIENIIASLKCRGPDGSNSLSFQLNEMIDVTFFGSVLWLQGPVPQPQPMSDEEGNILLWNGDILGGPEVPPFESDTALIMKELRGKDEAEIGQFLSSIRGPWNIIYYQSFAKRLFVGRDLLGRHSLLWSTSDDELIISSVASRDSALEEVPALGLFIIDLEAYSNGDSPLMRLIPWGTVDREELQELTDHFLIDKSCLRSSIETCFNRTIPTEEVERSLIQLNSSLSEDFFDVHFRNNVEIAQFLEHFERSIKRRIRACPPVCKNCVPKGGHCSHSRFAVLFSGGLDSAIIALMLGSCLPEDEPVDLLNVAFEFKPRPPCKKTRRSPNQETQSRPSFLTPDRKSGILCLNQLKKLQPNRTWNFIEVDITFKELQQERSKIISDLIAPLSTVLDDSIGCALYFCGRGIGLLNGAPYESPSRVLFSGLGADEQLAGYLRHRNRFLKDEWSGLIEEIQMEMARISSRNLGRDNRVLSHHGRTPRFPYLDEEVISFFNSLPCWKKANLHLPRGIGEKVLLRAAAASLGLTSAAFQPKRAIQFGSRIAKLENPKEKGSDDCARLENG